jgi:hypothetical protein
MQSETNEADTPLPANDIGSQDAAIAAAERSLYDAVIGHWCHQMNQIWGPDLIDDLEAFADQIETRARAIRKAKTTIRSLISTI